MSVPMVRSLIRRSSLVAASLGLALAAGCVDPAAVRVLTADMPLHLEDHLDAATVEGSELPATIPEPVEWRFDEPQPEWKVARPVVGGYRPADVARTGDGLRVFLPEGKRNPRGSIVGGVYIDLPDWRREEWAEVLVRARTADPVVNLILGLDPREGTIAETWDPLPQVFQTRGGSTPIVSDGSLQTYRIRPDWGDAEPRAWRRIGLGFQALEPGSIEILSVSVVPTAALYADDRVGQRSIAVAGEYRRSLYTHAPGSIAYPVRVPESGQLHTALGVLGTDTAVDFRVVARSGSGEATTLLSETYADAGERAERSVDLSAFAGQTITLALETRAEEPGTVAFWGAPTVSGVRRSDKPNVILYIFDGGSADYMSAYGYHRRTTPTLERLAAEGALFEHAYSNSGDTRLSTPSFMTSLQFSVLGAPDRFESLPAQARTMAEHVHGAGYQTAVFTDNSNASTVSGLQRGVDVLREHWEDVIGNNESSRYLHEGFWSWRKASPGEPYWVHFQTTDLHRDFPAPPPFAGLFVGQAEREKWLQDDSLGISRTDFYGVQIGLYAEAMAHNDYRLGQLVERLKAQGEWENTLLIIGADHGFGSAMGYIAPRLVDPMPPPWSEAILQPQASGVPLIFVWPGHIPAGQRLDQAVSMIDVLPTVLDLVGLPPAEISQGQSLVPLLMGREGWEPRPVILEELGRNPVDGRLSGLIEVVDGRWGASLEINPDPDTAEDERRPVPLLLYDLWTDPMAFWSVHAEHPDLVEKYTTFLEEQFAAHQALAARFTPGGQVVLTPGQLERLRALGYIR